MKHFLVLLIFLVGTTQLVRAQQPYFYNINDEDGLPSNEVYQVIQDSFGFMWIGCDAGLYRYDGFNFKSYSNVNQNSRSISNLRLDKDGEIWCQNFTGQIFHVRNDSLHLFFDGSKLSRQYPFFTIDELNHVWISNESMIIVKNKQGKTLKNFFPKDFQGKQNHTFFDIESDQKGNIYVHDLTQQLFVINNKTFESFPIALSKELATPSQLLNLNNTIYILAETFPNRIYIVVKIENGKATQMVQQIPETSSTSHYTIQNVGNKILMGTSNGAYVLEPSFTIDPTVPKMLTNHKVSYIYYDKEGNTWLTTLQDGIFIIPNLGIHVYNTNNSALTDNNIYSVVGRNKSELYIGTYTGEIFTLSPYKKINPIQNILAVSHRAVRKIHAHNGKLFIARGNFCVIDNHREEIIKPMGNTRDFEYQNDTLFFVSTHRTGYTVKTQGTYTTTIIREKGGKKVLYDRQQKGVYFACTDGLFFYDCGTRKLVEIKDGNKPLFITDLELDSNTVWAGSISNGILQLKRNRVIKRINTNNTLLDNNIKCFTFVGSKLYVCTFKGIQVIDTTNNQTQLLNTYDGIASTEINEITLWKGEIYLATIRGLIQLPLYVTGQNKVRPSIAISNVSVNGHLRPKNKQLQLSYHDNNIRIDFVGTALRSRGHSHYEYRLKNFNNTWQRTNSKSPFASFISIPPGAYIFEVVSVNEDGVRSKKPVVLPIVVEAPYWQKWWFYALIAVITAAMVATFFILRIKYLKRSAITKNKLILSQLTAIKAQMNPHFMFNTLNSIQDLILKSDIKNTNYYLSKFSSLMRKVLEASEHNEIALQEEIEMLTMYLELEKLRFGDEFTFQISNNINSNKLSQRIPSMIIQPYAENAMKHGLLHKKGNKKLDISFYEKNDSLFCVITDNGIGIKRGMEIKKRTNMVHKSFATKATEKRLELINSARLSPIKLSIRDAYPENEFPGTEVIIEIPLP